MPSPLPDISIVVVSWNVREALRGCLQSLREVISNAGETEVIVIDNLSNDGSADMVGSEFGWVKLIMGQTNLGFAKACNTAAAIAKGDILVFLNPDTVVPANFVNEVQASFAAHPQASVMGGRLVDLAGDIQPSVRNLPSLWSSVLDALKLLHRLPWLAPSYLAQGFDYSKPARVEQVKGACFAISRAAWEKLGGFDEDYFVWFEEVDFCFRAKQVHAEIWYDPKITITHVGAASFSQLDPLVRHRLFMKSLITYASKNIGRLSSYTVALAGFVGSVPAGLLQVGQAIATSKYGVKLAVSLVGLLAFDALSWFAFNHQLTGSLLVLLGATIWMLVAHRSVALGVALLATELIVGSQGRLLVFDVLGYQISLRLALFLCAFGFMVGSTVVSKRSALWAHPLKYPYLLALVAIAWGGLVAWARGNEMSNIVLDVNGYLYLLILPLFIEAAATPKLLSWFKLLLPAALAWLAVKTVGAQYIFSHIPGDWLVNFYKWWRDTGFGEITYVSGNFFRIFSQSQVYAAMAVPALFVLYSLHKNRLRLVQSALLVSGVVLLASLSRSFWLGSGLAIIAAFLYIIVNQSNKRATAARFAVGLCLLAAAGGLVILSTRVSWPLKPLNISEASVFATRLRGEAASASRLQLLGPLWQRVSEHPVLGSGFGSTVTFFSLDPRLIRSTAGGTGLTTTYAFEWGYLDAFLKLGFVASTAFFMFILAACWYTYRRTPWLGFGLLSLCILNMTTPYLNHPLGLGAIMIAVAWSTAIHKYGPSSA